MNDTLELRPALVETAPVAVTPELIDCLNRVEYYQPLYGVTGLEDPLRGCRDRAVAIEGALSHLPKPFRMVDFGASLGYFPFYFADRGAITTGFDINARNTDVCLATQRLNGLPATFGTAALDLETVRAIPRDEYDVGIILSVLHHITHRRGVAYVTAMVAELLDRVPTLVLELAHRDEAVPYAWRASLPEDPLAILAGCRDVHVYALGAFPSHLSATTRPMYLVAR